MDGIAILRGGTVCGVGLNAPAAMAAIRCAISGFREISYPDRGGELISGSTVPLEKQWRGIERLRRMLAMAIDECLSGSDMPWETIPLLLCLAEPDRPARANGLDTRVVSAVEDIAGGRFHPTLSHTIAEGRVSAALALARARQLIAEHGVPFVLIAGVDTLLTRATLRSFERKDRLKTSRNSNGFIPGEAAAAVLVGTPQRTVERQLLCVGLGFGVEPATVEGDAPLRADGLSGAIGEALADAGCAPAELDFRITDNSGEQYYFKEAALALARTLTATKEAFDVWHPSDCVGEVGAAIGPIILNLALAASNRRYAPGPGILCHLGNDAGRRAAAVLRYQ